MNYVGIKPSLRRADLSYRGFLLSLCVIECDKEQQYPITLYTYNVQVERGQTKKESCEANDI
jgi:hypothetical protein